MASLVHPIDIAIFVVSLMVTLFVGLRHGSSVKTLKDYALGGKNFSTSTLVATIVATWITGSFLTWRIGDIYSNGLYAVILYMCDIGTLALIGWIFAMRMGPFLQNTSIAEAMGDIYGKPVRIITALFGLLVTIGLVGLQFKTGEKIFSTLLGWNSVRTQTFIGFVIICYSAFGGIRAVTFTDIFQFITFGTLIPILALIIWNDMRDFNAVLNMFQEVPDFNIRVFLTSASAEKRWGFFTLIPLYLIPAFSPPIFQRAAMAKNVHQVRQAFLYSALIYFFLFLFIVWIAILIRTENSSLDPSYVFQYIVERYTSVGIAGLLLAGLMAMIMSTADSNLNAAAVIFANDIMRPTMVSRKYSLLKSVRSDGNQLFIARVGSVVIGLLSLLLALNSDSHLYRKLVLGAWGYYMPVVSVPLLLAILGFRSTTRAVLIGMAAGFTTVYLWDSFLAYTNMDSNLPGILANVMGLLGSHYILKEPGGWQQLGPSSPLALERAARRQAWQRRLQAIKRFQIYPYLQQNLPAQEGFYFFFGLYAMAATYAALYTIGDVEHQDYQPIYTGIYHAVLPITTAFLTFPIWPLTMKSKRFITFFWPIGIGGILFFAGTLLVIMSRFHHMQVMIMMINLLMAVLLLRWPLALFLAFVGTASGCFLLHYTGTALSVSVPGSFQLLYLLLLFTSLFIARKNKQVYHGLINSYEQLKETSSFSSEVLMETIHQRGQLIREINMYQLGGLDAEVRHTQTKEELWAINAVLRQDIYNLQVHNSHLIQMLHQSQDYLRLTTTDILLEDLLQGVFEDTHEQKRMQVCTHRYTTHRDFQVDVKKMRQLLASGLRYAKAYQQAERPILLGLEDTLLVYPILSIASYIKQVPSMRITITTGASLPSHQAWYVGNVDSPALHLPRAYSELPITHNQQIVDAHYGTSEFIESAHGMTQIYVIPVRVREVRPQTMDLLSATEVVSDTAIYPAEVAFVQEVTEKIQVDRAMLQQALQLIKQYHAGVKRKSEEPFYLHPIAVAHILLDYTRDRDTIIAALLHDTVANTKLSLNQIALHFNPEVQRIVDGVTCLDSRPQSFKRIQLSDYESIQKLLEVKDDRILYVKLADRLHNMRTIGEHRSLTEQKKIAEETLQFFVPMARGLGLKPMAEELKERCFAVLNGKPGT